MDNPTHVMSFAGAGGGVESITLCGVEPCQVLRVLVRKGFATLVDTAGQIPMTDMRMRIEFTEHISASGAPIVLSAWIADGHQAELVVLVAYRAKRARRQPSNYAFTA